MSCARTSGSAGCCAATFPPASVTGAPKPRVLQEIEDLEPVARGVYCGAVGWIDTVADRADLAVAIRTFTVTAGATQLGVGGGHHRGLGPGGGVARDRAQGRAPARPSPARQQSRARPVSVAQP